MEVTNYLATVTFDQHGDTLTKCRTFLKAEQPEIQQRIDTDIKFRMDMGSSVMCAGMAAMILEMEQRGGYDRWHNYNQVVSILHYYLSGGINCFRLEDFEK